MADIESIHAEQLLDSRGTPTLKVVVTAGGHSGSFSVPSGASTGSHEALELRDGDPSQYAGKGVQKAIEAVRSVIAPALLGKDASDQAAIDALLVSLDGTANKSRLGANAILGVSMASAHAAAKAAGLELYAYVRSLATIAPSRRVPLFFMNLINGGLHAKTRLPFQEYHIVPKTDDSEEALSIGMAVEDELALLLFERGETARMGDEGGLAVDTDDVAYPLVLLSAAVKRCGFEDAVAFALDVAASSFFKDGQYYAGGQGITAEQLAAIYADLIARFPIIAIEDPFDEESFADFAALRRAHPGLKVIGDDLTVTNKGRLAKAISENSITTLLVKLNQIGTLSETLDVMRAAREAGIDLVVSHRSGETMDDSIADLAYAFGCLGLKAGAPKKSERRVKYERLIRIAKMDA